MTNITTLDGSGVTKTEVTDHLLGRAASGSTSKAHVRRATAKDAQEVGRVAGAVRCGRGEVRGAGSRSKCAVIAERHQDRIAAGQIDVPVDTYCPVLPLVSKAVPTGWPKPVKRFNSTSWGLMPDTPKKLPPSPTAVRPCVCKTNVTPSAGPSPPNAVAW